MCARSGAPFPPPPPHQHHPGSTRDAPPPPHPPPSARPRPSPSPPSPSTPPPPPHSPGAAKTSERVFARASAGDLDIAAHATAPARRRISNSAKSAPYPRARNRRPGVPRARAPRGFDVESIIVYFWCGIQSGVRRDQCIRIRRASRRGTPEAPRGRRRRARAISFKLPARAARRDPFDTRYAYTRPWVIHSRDDRLHPARRRGSPAGARRPDLTLTFEGLRKRRGM